MTDLEQKMQVMLDKYSRLKQKHDNLVEEVKKRQKFLERRNAEVKMLNLYIQIKGYDARDIKRTVRAYEDALLEAEDLMKAGE